MFCGQPLPRFRPHPLGVLLAACTPASACPLRRSSFCWRFYSYSASRPSPRAALPLGAEAGDPYGSRFLPCLIVRLARVGRAAPPPCAGRNPSLRSIASTLAPHPLGVLLAASTFIQSCCSLRPPVARASRPPPAGSDTRRCSCLCAGRLTRTLWVFYWQPLPDKPIPYQRQPFLPRAPGKSCSKAIHAFERFSPSSRGARCRSAHEPGSLYPTKENCPQAGQAPRARGGQ